MVTEEPTQMNETELAALALGLPEVVEQDHHGMRSFRIEGKIFATVPDEHHVRIMLDEGDALAAVAEEPSGCTELWWGGRLSGILVDLKKAEPQLLKELLADAFRRKAPKRLR